VTEVVDVGEQLLGSPLERGRRRPGPAGSRRGPFSVARVTVTVDVILAAARWSNGFLG
jgi:hypothetical protein